MQRNETRRVRITNLDTTKTNAQSSYESEVWFYMENGQWHSVTDCPRWPYSLIGALCHERALDVEDGLLLVNGDRINAERYLAIWRESECLPAAHVGFRGYALQYELKASIASFEHARGRAKPEGDLYAVINTVLQRTPVANEDGIAVWLLPLPFPGLTLLTDHVQYMVPKDAPKVVGRVTIQEVSPEPLLQTNFVQPGPAATAAEHQQSFAFYGVLA